MGLFDIFRISRIKEENEQLKAQVADLDEKLNSLGYPELVKIEQLLSEARSNLAGTNSMIDARNASLQSAQKQYDELSKKYDDLSKSVKTQTAKLNKLKDYISRAKYSIDVYVKSEKPTNTGFSDVELEELESLCPSVILKLHCMDVKDLRKAYRDNDKQIDKLLKEYSARYTTKSNKAIYNLMVIALRAELQNILYNLKYEKLDKSIEDVKTVTTKYLQIAGDGNQSIASTLTKFIGEVEYLFINAVKIEYNYYVKREQAKQEQMALKEQMRQEAEERKALETEKKKIEKEEEKFNVEISKVNDLIANTSDASELQKLQARILELQLQLSNVVVKKEEITNLQNGKAGTVYIISNIGSFGENVFKVGMTRRLEPQDRINELNSASVPFKFDVHSFIFSEDAVELEHKMHTILDTKRVNKVNLRKEFFNVTLDELESVVNDVDPTAEFNKTILAEEFYQSISSEENYTSDYVLDDSDEDDEE